MVTLVDFNLEASYKEASRLNKTYLEITGSPTQLRMIRSYMENHVHTVELNIGKLLDGTPNNYLHIFFNSESGYNCIIADLHNCLYLNHINYDVDYTPPMKNAILTDDSDNDEELIVISKRIHNRWEVQVYDDLQQFKGKSTFLDELINAVAQFRYDRLNGEGAFSKLPQSKQLAEFETASEYVTAVRDLGHLLN